jgi:hypothetical protein
VPRFFSKPFEAPRPSSLSMARAFELELNTISIAKTSNLEEHFDLATYHTTMSIGIVILGFVED